MAKPEIEHEYLKTNWHFENILKCFRDKRKKLSIALENAFADCFDINCTPSGAPGITVLRKVVSSDDEPDIEYVKLLIENGASVNIPDKLGYIPLMDLAYTWRVKQLNLIHLIMEHTKDINAKSNSGKTAFSYFCKDIVAYGYYGSKDVYAKAFTIIKDFLDAGADPYLDDSWLTYDRDILYGIEYSDAERTERKKEITTYINSYMEQKQSVEANYEYEL